MKPNYSIIFKKTLTLSTETLTSLLMNGENTKDLPTSTETTAEIATFNKIRITLSKTLIFYMKILWHTSSKLISDNLRVKTNVLT